MATLTLAPSFHRVTQEVKQDSLPSDNFAFQLPGVCRNVGTLSRGWLRLAAGMLFGQLVELDGHGSSTSGEEIELTLLLAWTIRAPVLHPAKRKVGRPVVY